MSLERFHWTYIADPEVLILPHGLDRLRKAYEIYLSEEDNPVKYEEGRKRLKEWSA